MNRISRVLERQLGICAKKVILMSNKALPFSHTDYDKLQHPVFPTIRRRDKYGDVGDVRPVIVGSKGDRETWGKAKVIAKETVTINELPTSFLTWDTNVDVEAVMFGGKHPGKQAYQSLNKFYKNRIQPDEELTLYWNQWTETNEQVDL